MRHFAAMLRSRGWAGVAGLVLAAVGVFSVPAEAQRKSAEVQHPEDAAIVDHLNAAITWYRELERTNENAGQPSDAFFLDNARSFAREALRLAFESADAEVSLLLAEQGGDKTIPATAPSAPTTPGAVNQGAVSKATASTTALIKQAQDQIENLNGQIAKSHGKRREALTAQRESLQEQLNFNKVLEEQLEKLSTFMSDTVAVSGEVHKEIENLKNSVPDLFAKAPSKPAASPNPSSSAPVGTGLVSQVAVLFARIGDARDIGHLIDGGAGVIDKVRAVQTPLRTRIHNTIQQARGLANQTAPQAATDREANQQKMALLTVRLKQISDASIPLAQEILVLQQSQASLRQWESSVNQEYIRTLKSLLVRLAFLGVGIGIVLGFSEFWRRATFRYVQDPRRRHQVLLLQRGVTLTLMAVVLALGFVSEFSSLATYVGLLTAGIAVALQTVILSVAAYFFLIGRRGVRVGDRVTVAGVTGDVIEVGIVRLYIMELGGAGADLYPTGRVMVISNSVLFQGTPFFKQIPGTAYTWKEVGVKLERDSDYGVAEKKLLAAVNAVYSEYRPSIEQQHQSLQGLGAVPFEIPSPQARLQLVENVLELVVRYPVVLNRETEIDNMMARQVMGLINSDAELKSVVGSPSIRPATK